MDHPSYVVDPLTQGMIGLKLQARAGDSALLSAFTQGNIIQLESQSTGKNLRVIDGAVDGKGGQGKPTNFMVHVRRRGVVALQNTHEPARWLGVSDGRTIGTGQGGPYCDLMVGEIEGRYVVLESCQHPGQRIGILTDGSTKKAFETGTGQHGRFIPIVKQCNDPDGPPSPLLSVFQQGAKVRLRSKASGKNLRIKDGNVDGNGGDGEFSTFIVHVRAEGVVSLQSMPDPSRWLRITAEGTLDGKGSGHQWTKFRVKPIASDSVSLESVVFPEWHVGILPTGETKLGKHTHTGQHGQFYPYKP